MGAADHYETLGVCRNASKADIKNAFFRQAHRYHPDHHPAADAAARAEAASRFRRVKDAYEVLSDDSRRAAYDSGLHCRKRTGGGHGGNASGTSSSSSSSSSSNGHGHSGASSSSSSSSSSDGHAHGNSRHGHAGGFRAWPRPRPPPMGEGTKSTLIYIALWAVVLSGIVILGHYFPDVEPEDERIKRVWRVPMAEYHSPSYVPKGMVSAWKVRNELSKKKWWMQDVKWPIGRKM